MDVEDVDPKAAFTIPAVSVNKKYRFRWVDDDDVTRECDVVLATSEVWAKRDDLRSPLWHSLALGGRLILGVRVTR